MAENLVRELEAVLLVGQWTIAIDIFHYSNRDQTIGNGFLVGDLKTLLLPSIDLWSQTSPSLALHEITLPVIDGGPLCGSFPEMAMTTDQFPLLSIRSAP
jgi:hypothetical protein